MACTQWGPSAAHNGHISSTQWGPSACSGAALCVLKGRAGQGRAGQLDRRSTQHRTHSKMGTPPLARANEKLRQQQDGHGPFGLCAWKAKPKAISTA
eukprot:330937-Chlamydomonas_euryale.AAC.4